MTQTLARARPAGTQSREVDRVGSVWVRGAFAALSTVAVGVATLVVIVLGVWAADSRSGSSAGAAIRIAIDLWLLSGRVPIHTAGATIVLAPVGLTLLLALLLARATAVVARGSRCASARDVGIVIASVTGPYAVLVTVLAVAASGPAARPSPVTALLAGAVVGGLASALGAARGAGMTGELWRWAPRHVRTPLTAAGGALATLTGAAAVLVLVAVGVHHGAEQRVLTADGGVTAQISVAVLCVLALPNAVGWGIGYLTGPGFAAGAGSSVGFTGSHLGALPAFPLAAALPQGTAAAVTAGCIVALLAAGVVAGCLVIRRSGVPLLQQVSAAAAAGAATGLGSAVVAALSGGGAGPGRMATLGPSPWQVGLVSGAEVGVVAVLSVLVWSWVGLARASLAAR
jgi:hypothetical protein